MPGKSASFFQTAASVLERMNSGADGQLGRAWQMVNPWVTRLLANAATKWIPILSHNAPCQIATPDGNGGWVPCQHPAIAFCDCCGKPTCLQHARVDSNAGAICFPCVATARALKQSERASYQPPPSGQEAKKPEKQPLPRDEALKRLGLTAASSPQEIKATYKALVRKWHPDKHADADKAAAERRFREVQEAWEALKA